MSDGSKVQPIEHAQPPYVAIWLALVALLAVSLALGVAGHKAVATLLVLGVAVVKAALVVAYYMHLKFEPLMVVLVVVAGLACAGVLAVACVPDIVYVFGG